MDEQEIRKSAALEDRHWWYAGRREMLRRLLADEPPGDALDVGCGGGGNTTVLRELGHRVSGLEYSPAAAAAARSRGLGVVRADARRLPFGDASFDLVISCDLWEHVDDDAAVARETHRVLRPGGRALVAVPCDMRLWSGHDLALGHLRRYDRESLGEVITAGGLELERMRSWNVLLRPVARARRRRAGAGSAESEMEETAALLNGALRAVLAVENRLPVGRLPGVSLVALARKPA